MKRKLRRLPPLVKETDRRLIGSSEPKAADRELGTAAHRQWRMLVKQRAGWRCEWINDDGSRCAKSAPDHVMIADHIIERADGGPLYDPANGQCLCPVHHGLKTELAKLNRAQGVGG